MEKITDPQPGEWRIDPRTGTAYQVISIGPEPQPWVRMERTLDGQRIGRHALLDEVRCWAIRPG